ncbi:hypothetical protein PHYPO_G00143420 [Pangasianodon hypophthalmus]|uniref:RING-type E3 ubiquitin transferase n=1 Tax=Pangasianodon hypophthalmus TaxID=310915 RepID=A0A5N5KEG5_PANHP|nr:hypothetical protein PHYPO_G00143420 [Pangasianodon hypophthalmus]
MFVRSRSTQAILKAKVRRCGDPALFTRALRHVTSKTKRSDQISSLGFMEKPEMEEPQCSQSAENETVETEQGKGSRRKRRSSSPSQVSMKSADSMIQPMHFSSGKRVRKASPEPDHLSMKSDDSMIQPLHFSQGEQQKYTRRSSSPSQVSMKSADSMIQPMHFSSGKRVRKASPEPDHLSMKSDDSMMQPLHFSQGEQQKYTSELLDEVLTCSVCTEYLKDPVSTSCGHTYCRSCITKYQAQSEHGESACPKCGKTSGSCSVLHTNIAVAESAKKIKLAQHSSAEVIETGEVELRLCPEHHKALVMFCKSDQATICKECAVKKHREHEKQYIKISTVPNTLITLQNILGSMTASEFREFKRNLGYEYPECFETLQASSGTQDVAEKMMGSFSEDEVLKVTIQLASVKPAFLLSVTGSSYKGLLPQLGKESLQNDEIVQFIKDKIREEDRTGTETINLFHCLNELGHNCLVKDIQESLRSGTLCDKKFNPEQCSALAYVLLMSEDVMEVFDLRKYKTTQASSRQRLLPVIRASKKAILSECELSEKACEIVASALRIANSPVRELDLSHNNIEDAGLVYLCKGLKSPHCQLEILRLAACKITDKSCGSLASALASAESNLRELDLSLNKLTNTGVMMLEPWFKSEQCKVQRLRLKQCNLTKSYCKHLAEELTSSSTKPMELDLTGNDLED